MLRYTKVISRLSKLSVSLHKSPNLTGLTGVTNVRCKHVNTSKKISKLGVTVKPEECAPAQTKAVPTGERTPYPCPPKCEETCTVARDGPQGGGPPCGGGNSWQNMRDYWKQILAALLLTGFTIYVVTNEFKKFPDTNKVGERAQDEVKKQAKKKKKKGEIPKNPAHHNAIPKEIPYLLIGGGTAAFSAFRSIKSRDPCAKVLVVSAEPHLPYMRPPLSKELWYNHEKNMTKSSLTFKQWNGGRRSLFYEPPEFFMDISELAESEKGGVSVITGWKVSKIDAHNKIAELDTGYQIKYDKCLIATGGTPKIPPVLNAMSDEVKEKVILYRTVDDFIELEENVKETSVRNIIIVGGGFLGSELACSLARTLDKNNKVIYQLVKEKSIMAQILPEYLSEWLTKKLHSEGIHCVPNAEIEDYDYKDKKLTLKITGGQTFEADQVVLAVGVEPNTEFAENSCLEVDPEIGGYLVNAELQARTDLWVAGDSACFYDVNLGRRRVEHHDHAVISGRLAGENMTGAGKPYLHQSMFWSDLTPEIGFEAIGIVDSALPTVGVFAKLDDPSEDAVEKKETPTDSETNSDSEEDPEKPLSDYSKGVIFYLRENTIVGIVLWNLYNRMTIARQVIAQGAQYEDLNEVAKLFAIHED